MLLPSCKQVEVQSIKENENENEEEKKEEKEKIG